MTFSCGHLRNAAVFFYDKRICIVQFPFVANGSALCSLEIQGQGKMLALIIGGSGSGKSAFAEKLLASAGPGGIYLATMEPFGEEGRARIARHRAQRAALGFLSMERYTDLVGARIPQGANVLLEDLSNLLANEMFSPEGSAAATQMKTADPALDAVRRGTDCLAGKCDNLIIVTNEVFSGGSAYEGETLSFLKNLAILNREIASRADLVAEIVCGIPHVLKGELPDGIETGFDGGEGRPASRPAAPARWHIRKKRLDERGAPGLIFVTGPLSAGKREYIRNALGMDEETFAGCAVWNVQDMVLLPETEEVGDESDVSRPDGNESGGNGFGGDGIDVKIADLEALADRLARKEIVIATEVGGGIVPVEPRDRAAREAAGRLSCLLARRADTVIRVCCGLPQLLKGEWPQGCGPGGLQH